MSRNATIWLNTVVTSLALAAGGFGLMASHRWYLLGLWLVWSGGLSCVGGGLSAVALGTAAEDARESVSNGAAKGQLIGWTVTLAGMAVGAGIAYYQIIGLVCGIGVLWTATTAGLPLYSWLAGRPERKRLTEKLRRREIEDMEREVGLR